MIQGGDFVKGDGTGVDFFGRRRENPVEVGIVPIGSMGLVYLPTFTIRFN